MSDTKLEKILIIDDNSDYRKLINTFISKLLPSIEVLEYDPVFEGVPGDDFNWSEIDVLLLDYHLSIVGTTGLDILHKHHKKSSFPATIMLTGAGTEEIAIRALKTGIYEYQPKQSLTKDKLKQSIIHAWEDKKEKRKKQQEITQHNKSFSKEVFYENLEKAFEQVGTERALVIIKPDDIETLEAEIGIIGRDNLVKHIAKNSFEVFKLGACNPNITRISDTEIGVQIDYPINLETLDFNMQGLSNHLSKCTFKYSEEKYKFSVSIGVLKLGTYNESAERLIKIASTACKHASKTKGNSYYIWKETDIVPDEIAGANFDDFQIKADQSNDAADEEKNKLEIELKAARETKEKADAKIQAEQEDKKRLETELKKAEEAKEKAEAALKKAAEQEAKAKAEEEARLKAEQEAKAKAEEEARLKAEQEAKAKAEEEARLKAEQEAKEKAEEEARLKAEQEAKEKAEEEARLKAEQEAKEKAEEEARLKAEQEAKGKAEEEARLKAEQEAKGKAEEEARLKAEQEAKEKAEEEARLKAEQEAKEKAEEEARLKAEQEAKGKAEEEARLKAEQEAKEKLQADAEMKATKEEKEKLEAELKTIAEAKKQAEAEINAAKEEKEKLEAELKTIAEAKKQAEAEINAAKEEENNKPEIQTESVPDKTSIESKQEKIQALEKEDLKEKETIENEFEPQIKKLIDEKRIIQTYQPVTDMFGSDDDSKEIYKTGLLAISESDELNQSLLDTSFLSISLQQTINEWILRQVFLRITESGTANCKYLFLITVNESWFSDITLFQWLQKILSQTKKYNPGKSIILDVPIDIFIKHQKRAEALIKTLRKSHQFTIALSNISAADNFLEYCTLTSTNLLIMDVAQLKKLSETIAPADKEDETDEESEKQNLLQFLKSKKIRTITTDIEDSTLLTEAIAAGADYTIGNFVGEVQENLTDSGHVESFELT